MLGVKTLKNQSHEKIKLHAQSHSQDQEYWSPHQKGKELHGDPPEDPGLYEAVVGKRVIAFCIDLGIMLVLFCAFGLLAMVLGILTLGLLWGPATALLSIFPILYHAFFIGSPTTASPGMRMMDLEVRSWDGEKPSYAQALIMALCFYISITLTSGLVLIFALFNGKNRNVQDYVAGTIVVNSSYFHQWRGQEIIPPR